MYKVYGDYRSGNCYKVKLMLHLLGRDYQWVPVDILSGETREPAFLEKNPNGKVPVLELEDGSTLWESNAILNYLAEGTELLPREPRLRTQVLQWQFFEQYSHEPYVATPRFILKHLPEDSPRRAELPERLERGRAALGVMETHLSRRTFFVAERYTIADIALYAYTHVAHEAQLDLTPYPSVRAWLARVAAQPRYVPITYRPE